MMPGVRSGTGAVVVVVVVTGTVVVVDVATVVVVTGAVVVVMAVGTAVAVVVAGAAAVAGAAGGHESASARGVSLSVNTVATTARAMTMAVPRPTPRRRTISRDATPVATRSNPRVTSTEMLAPVTGNWQTTKRDPTAAVGPKVLVSAQRSDNSESVATGTERCDALAPK